MGKSELKVEIDADLLARARAAGLAVEAAVEAGLQRALADLPRPLGLVESAARKALDPIGAEARARRWTEDNAEAIAEHNRFVEEHGLVADYFRKW